VTTVCWTTFFSSSSSSPKLTAFNSTSTCPENLAALVRFNLTFVGLPLISWTNRYSCSPSKLLAICEGLFHMDILK